MFSFFSNFRIKFLIANWQNVSWKSQSGIATWEERAISLVGLTARRGGGELCTLTMYTRSSVAQESEGSAV